VAEGLKEGEAIAAGGKTSSSGALITSLHRSRTRIEGIIFRGLTY